jgi:ferredoxin-NADP reductase
VPVQLIGGGSGVVPLMAMVRARSHRSGAPEFRLMYSVRSPETVIYQHELGQLAETGTGLQVDYIFTRTVPPGYLRRPGRVDGATLADLALPASRSPQIFICGPTGFVEAASDLLVTAGYDTASIKTERFGPSG